MVFPVHCRKGYSLRMNQPLRALPRRQLLVISLAALAFPGEAIAQKPAAAMPLNMNPPEVAKLVEEKKIILIDIRRPEEWAETGVAEGAHKLDMTDPLFLSKLAKLTGNKRNAPVALICRTANRTRVVQSYLLQSGHTNIVNVEGGMVGNSADKGWVKHGLKIVSGQ
jgi:rhodanese-related sulfurtransferase